MTNQNSSAKKTHSPYDYLKFSCRSFGKSVVSFSYFAYYGIKWLFTNYPNISWGVIVFFLVAFHVISDAKTKAERDSYSKENAILIDSISMINMDRVSYLNMDNKVTSAIRPDK